MQIRPHVYPYTPTLPRNAFHDAVIKRSLSPRCQRKFLMGFNKARFIFQPLQLLVEPETEGFFSVDGVETGLSW